MKTDKSAGTNEAEPVRDRIVGAAFGTFIERGFSRASTLEIATRAKVSKRELYSHFRSKEDLFAAGITERTDRMRNPLVFPDVTNSAALAGTLKSAGVAVLTGVTDPHVIAVYRLAIAEAERSPQVAATLDGAGRGEIRRGLSELIKKAQGLELLKAGSPGGLADEFCALLFSDLLVRLLLGVARRPSARQIAQRAQCATDTFLVLHGEEIARARPAEPAVAQGTGLG